MNDQANPLPHPAPPGPELEHSAGAAGRGARRAARQQGRVRVGRTL